MFRKYKCITVTFIRITLENNSNKFFKGINESTKSSSIQNRIQSILKKTSRKMRKLVRIQHIHRTKIVAEVSTSYSLCLRIIILNLLEIEETNKERQFKKFFI